jgi:hypothetical protein
MAELAVLNTFVGHWNANMPSEKAAVLLITYAIKSFHGVTLTPTCPL